MRTAAEQTTQVSQVTNPGKIGTEDLKVKGNASENVAVKQETIQAENVPANAPKTGNTQTAAREEIAEKTEVKKDGKEETGKSSDAGKTASEEKSSVEQIREKMTEEEKVRAGKNSARMKQLRERMVRTKQEITQLEDPKAKRTMSETARENRLAKLRKQLETDQARYNTLTRENERIGKRAETGKAQAEPTSKTEQAKAEKRADFEEEYSSREEAKADPGNNADERLTKISDAAWRDGQTYLKTFDRLSWDRKRAVCATIQSAKDAGVTSRLVISASAKLASIRSGLEIRFSDKVASSSWTKIDPEHGERLVLVSTKSADQIVIRTELVHEMIHDLRYTNSAAYAKIKKAAFDLTTDERAAEIYDQYTGHFNEKNLSDYLKENNLERTEENIDKYFEKYDGISRENVEEEITAKYVMNDARVNRLFDRLGDRSTWRKFLDAVSDFRKVISERFSGKGEDEQLLVSQSKSIEKTILKALGADYAAERVMRAYGYDGKEAYGERGTGNRKFDIAVMDNGMTYVKASRKIISGNNVAEWRKQITEFFRALLDGNESLDIPTIEGDVLTITKKETANKARDNYQYINGKRVVMTDDEFAVKLKVESHIDEIAETSRKTISAKPDTKNHSFAKDGFSYRTAYFEDFDGQYYKVMLSVGEKSSTATVYNVGKIKEDTAPSAKLIAVVGSQPLGSVSSDNSISQKNNLSTDSSQKVQKKNLAEKSDMDFLFDDEFYSQFENESKEPIKETIKELQEKKNSQNFANLPFEEAYDINAKLSALTAGYTTLYDYYVGREKERLMKDYRFSKETGKSTYAMSVVEKKRKAYQKEQKLKTDMESATALQNAQFRIIQETNPMFNDTSVGIRSPKEILTFAETLSDTDSFNWGDFSREDAEKALKRGTVKVYSSYPIKNGVFVSTSFEQALEYAGGDPKGVHSRTVALDSVAWINGDEGQYAKVYNINAEDSGNTKFNLSETSDTDKDAKIAELTEELSEARKGEEQAKKEAENANKRAKHSEKEAKHKMQAAYDCVKVVDEIKKMSEAMRGNTQIVRDEVSTQVIKLAEKIGRNAKNPFKESSSEVFDLFAAVKRFMVDEDAANPGMMAEQNGEWSFADRFSPRAKAIIEELAAQAGEGGTLSEKDLYLVKNGLRALKKAIGDADKVVINERKESLSKTAAEGVSAIREAAEIRGKNADASMPLQFLKKTADVVRKTYLYQTITPRAVIESLECYSEKGVLSRVYRDVEKATTAAADDFLRYTKTVSDFLKENKGYGKRTYSGKKEASKGEWRHEGIGKAVYRGRVYNLYPDRERYRCQGTIREVTDGGLILNVQTALWRSIWSTSPASANGRVT